MAGLSPMDDQASLYRSRRQQVIESAEAGDLEAVIIYGNLYAPGAIQHLTGFLPRRDAYLLVGRDAPHELFVQFFNHVPNARELAAVPLVSWGGPESAVAVATRVRSGPRLPRRLGLVGPIPHQQHHRLVSELPGVELVDMSALFGESRLVKDRAEIEQTRRGAALCDEALAHLIDSVSPGATERGLGAAVGSYCASRGGEIGICFLLTTSMGGEGRYVPAQHWSDRVLESGDMVVVELSAGYRGHTGQLLRTIVLGEPPDLVVELHRVATTAFNAIANLVAPGARASDLLAAAAVIDDAGFTVCDDVVHGYGGGYLPPVLRTPTTQHVPLPDLELEPGMMLVVQPNVITPDLRVGVQTGELLLVTEDGHEPLHGFERGLISADV